MKSMQPLAQPDEAEYIRKFAYGLKAAAIFLPLIAIVIVVAVPFMSSRDLSDFWDFLPILLAAIVVTLAALFFFIGSIRYVPWDEARGQKVVEKSKLLKINKVGFFDVETGLAGMMMGSAYYLWIADGDKRSGKRRFRIRMDAYEVVRGLEGQEITMSYLPKSRYVLTIETPHVRYRACDNQQVF